MKRRSIFPAQYTGEIIENSIIKAILEDANNAPSHKNTEPWRFKVYAGESKQELGNTLASAYEKYTPDDKFSSFKQQKIHKKLVNTSHIIGINMLRHEASGLPEWEEIAAVACAVQNIYLSCTLKNLGCYWSTPKYICEHPEVLNLSKDEKCLGLVYVGVPKDNIEFTVEKGDVSEKIEWV